MTPLASICIPTLSARRLPYLREAVACALAQTCEDIEVVVSDDGHDSCIRDYVEEQIARRCAGPLPAQSRRLGLGGGNWNAVAGDAHGEYLVIIGDDDRLLPRFVETLLSARGADTAVLFSNHHVIDPNGVPTGGGHTRISRVVRSRRTAPGRGGKPRRVRVAQHGADVVFSRILTAHAKRLGIEPDLNTQRSSSSRASPPREEIRLRTRVPC